MTQDFRPASVGTIVNLLVKGEYETAAAITRNDRLSAEDLERAIEEYPGRLCRPPREVYDELVFERLEDVDGEVYHVDFDLWTEEEGRSDLTLEVRLSKTTYDTWESQIWNLHGL